MEEKDLKENLRSIEVRGDEAVSSSSFVKNKVNSSRYNPWTIIPLNIFEQFQKPSNLWFLIVTLLEISPLNSIPEVALSTIVPLLIILLLNLFKEIHLLANSLWLDAFTNHQMFLVWDTEEFSPKKSKDISVGEIVLVKENEKVPADLVLLCTSEEKVCYIDTFEVLGKRELKMKKPVKETQALLESFDLSQIYTRLSRLNAELKVVNPKQGYKDFLGKYKDVRNPRATQVDSHNFVMGSSVLLNTKWIIGVVVYAGSESKAWINNKIRSPKVSQIDKQANNWVFYFALLMVVLLSLTAFLALYKSEFAFEVNQTEAIVNNAILLGNIVPVSLFLGMDIIRFLQGKRIDKNYDSIEVKAGAVNEDLGQIEYILSDKTGTLTKNDLCVQVCVVGDQVFWKDDYEAPSELSRMSPINSRFNMGPAFQLSTQRPLKNEIYSVSNTFLALRSQLEYSKFEIKTGEITHFVKCMAMCNFAFPKGSEYIGKNIDDKVLAAAAAELGIRMVYRSSSTMLLDYLGTEREYSILGFADFSSEIKKCRIVVEKENGTGVLYVKGSKEAMLEIYDLPKEKLANIEENTLTKNLIGMRPILLGYKVLTKKETQEFCHAYRNAKLSPVNSEGRVEALFEELEKETEYLGIVGLEDTITEDTKQTVSLLSRSGIKTWLLSGDSESSVLAAGVGSTLLDENYNVVRLTNIQSASECINVLEHCIETHIFHEKNEETEKSESAEEGQSFSLGNHSFQNVRSEPCSFNQSSSLSKAKSLSMKKGSFVKYFRSSRPLMKRPIHPLLSELGSFGVKPSININKEFVSDSVYFVLSVDRESLETAMSTEEARKLFVYLLFAAHTVCFHSLFPDQKTKVVKLLKHNFAFKPKVLAIGDSSSDVGMIREAHIGVAVNSNQEDQSINAADIVVEKFSDLKDLILAEGHWSYVRMSNFVALSYYKSFLFTLVLLSFNLFADFSGSVVFNYNLVVLHDLVFTFMSLLTIGMFDKDLSKEKILIFPETYSSGAYGILLSVSAMMPLLGIAVVQAFFIDFFSISAFYSVLNSKGFTGNGQLLGVFVYLLVILSTILTFGVFTQKKTLLVYSGSIASMVSVVLYLVIESFTLSSANTLSMLFNSPSLIISVFGVSGICFLVSYLCTLYSRFQSPSILDYIKHQEAEEFTFEVTKRIDMYSEELEKVYKDTAHWKKKVNQSNFNINHISLEYLSETQETEYLKYKLTEYKNIYRLFGLVMIGSFVVGSVVLLVQFQVVSAPHLIFLINSLFFLLLFTLTWFKTHYVKFYQTYVFSGVIISQLSLLLLTLEFEHSLGLLLYPLFSVVYSIGLTTKWIKLMVSNCLGIFLAGLSAARHFQDPDTPSYLLMLLEYIVFYISLVATCLVICYCIDYSKRQEFSLLSKLKIEMDKSRSILGYLLPSFVKDQVKEGARYIAHDQGTVSILFCNICDFEEILNNYTPQELTAFLDEVFAKFDNLCDLMGVTKIETVGYQYMACAGLKDGDAVFDSYLSSVPHARRTVELAISILNCVNSIYLKNGNPLTVKIGVNSGPVTSGVVGFHKPQFSLVGDAVNTASRMASTISSKNTIQISQSTYGLIGDKKGIMFMNNQIEAKGKGIMNTYLVGVSNEIEETEETDQRQGTRSIVMPRFTFKPFKEPSSNKKLSSVENNKKTNKPLRRRSTEIIEEIQLCSFACRENQTEKLFRYRTVVIGLPILLNGLRIGLVCHFLALLIHIGNLFVSENSNFSIVSVILNAVESGLLLCLTLVIKKKFGSYWLAWALQLSFLMCIVTHTILILFLEEINQELETIRILYYFVLLTHCSTLFFKHIMLTVLISSGVWTLSAAFLFQSEEVALGILISLTFAVVLLVTIYVREKKLRNSSVLIKDAKKELNKVEKLINQMMPPHAYEHLKEENSFTDRMSDVTLIYADIVGFTAWSSDKFPEEIVGMLSQLFQRFDKHCAEHKVYKVHTIGDCYVAMGFTGDKPESRDPYGECLNMINFAKVMIDMIKEVNEEHEIQLNMRIGIHTGEVVGGITGTNIVRYDIYGPDVMIANKIESNGVPGSIAVSEVTKSFLENCAPERFKFTEHKEVVDKYRDRSFRTYLLREN